MSTGPDTGSGPAGFAGTPDDGGVGAASPVRVRVLGAGLLVVGCLHLVVPGLLLGIGRRAYDRTLNVRFRPQSGARRRVRLVGLAMIAGGGHLLFHGGLRPRW